MIKADIELVIVDVVDRFMLEEIRWGIADFPWSMHIVVASEGVRELVVRNDFGLQWLEVEVVV